MDGSGIVAKRAFYYPFGGNRGSAFSDLTSKRFTGQYHERDLPGGEGLSYYNARWYDAQLGRFVSADTIVPEPGNPQALNRYAYTFNNPLVYIDPDGHDPWWLQEPWYDKPDQNLAPVDSFGSNRQQKRVADHVAASPYSSRGQRDGGRKDAVGLYVSGPGSTTIAGPVGAVEGVYNMHNGDITLFAIVGGEVKIGADIAVAAQYNTIYKIGSDNLKYAGSFIAYNLTATNVFGFTAGGAYTPTVDRGPLRYVLRNKQGAYSLGAGPAFGLGASGSAAIVEYIPLLTLHADGTGEPHAGWYLFENDDTGFMADALGVMLQRFGEQYGINLEGYNWMNPVQSTQ